MALIGSSISWSSSYPGHVDKNHRVRVQCRINQSSIVSLRRRSYRVSKKKTQYSQLFNLIRRRFACERRRFFAGNPSRRREKNPRKETPRCESVIVWIRQCVSHRVVEPRLCVSLQIHRSPQIHTVMDEQHRAVTAPSLCVSIKIINDAVVRGFTFALADKIRKEPTPAAENKAPALLPYCSIAEH